MKKLVSVRLDTTTLSFLEDIAAETGLSRQKVIDLLGRICEDNIGVESITTMYNNLYKEDAMFLDGRRRKGDA